MHRTRPEHHTNVQTREGAPSVPAGENTAEERGIAGVTQVLIDPRFEVPIRLLRLQGWRGQDLDQACATGMAVRLAPAVCGLGGFAVLVSGSVLSALVVAATALIGMFADNHPVEMLYNIRARSNGRAEIPANRAAKRLGCALGAAFLSGASLAFLSGATSLGRGLALALAVVASFVAATNLCVPSVLFTLLFGSERASERTLLR